MWLILVRIQVYLEIGSPWEELDKVGLGLILGDGWFGTAATIIQLKMITVI